MKKLLSIILIAIIFIYLIYIITDHTKINILSIGGEEIKNKPKTKKRRIDGETIPRNEQFQRERQDEKNKKR